MWLRFKAFVAHPVTREVLAEVAAILLRRLSRGPRSR
jgi:hypothetical protein